MASILTVCIGNICRSPMAEALLAQALPGYTVSSAGIGALVGHPADDKAMQLMVGRGLDISNHRARQINRSLVQEADLIFVMDNRQKKFIAENFPMVTGKVFRLGEFAKQDVPDPYRMSQEAFMNALDLIDAGVKAWVPKIEKIYA